MTMTKSQKRQKITANRTPSRRASKARRQDKLPFTKEKETGTEDGPGDKIPKNIELKNDSGTVPTDATGKKPSYAEAASIPMQERLSTSLKEPKPPPQLRRLRRQARSFPLPRRRRRRQRSSRQERTQRYRARGRNPSPRQVPLSPRSRLPSGIQRMKKQSSRRNRIRVGRLKIRTRDGRYIPRTRASSAIRIPS
jgi:hypothetical protein